MFKATLPLHAKLGSWHLQDLQKYFKHKMYLPGNWKTSIGLPLCKSSHKSEILYYSVLFYFYFKICN